MFVAAASVALSPLALGLVDGDSGEWERMSLIGQTYGAVSALIAVFALAGIAATLVLQARENRRAVLESRRQAMNDLLRMAMDDPDLDVCWGPVPEPGDPRHRKQQLYLNMIVSQWQVAFETGAMPEERLRAIAEEMFSGAPGRAFWDRAGPKRMYRVGNDKQSRFSQILDEAYRAADEPAEPGPPGYRSPHSADRPGNGRGVLLAALLGGVAGVAIGASAVTAALRSVRRSR
ncbi:DUF6082 family protein [Murinocardiopsis flavida]|uniref:DUF6082 family protein n=1 Tax=Murinocardiopsis flavida TaxID=645275 RepID=UPI000D0E2823|nr:DUF6082 family protein [Murinocardiopsis flavida]